MLTYLICPSVQNFFYKFLENNDSFQILVGFRLNRFSYRGRLTGKFKPHRFLKTRLLVAGFYYTGVKPLGYYADEDLYLRVYCFKR